MQGNSATFMDCGKANDAFFHTFFLLIFKPVRCIFNQGDMMKFGYVFLVLSIFLIMFVSGCVNGVPDLPGVSVASLLSYPVYDTDTEVYGEVSDLGELFCSCFTLTSGGESIQVWYDTMTEPVSEEMVCCEIYGYGAMMDKVSVKHEWKLPEECTVPVDFVGGGKDIVDDANCGDYNAYEWPSVDVSGIKNGDMITVIGHLRSGTGSEPSTTFWASAIRKYN